MRVRLGGLATRVLIGMAVACLPAFALAQQPTFTEIQVTNLPGDQYDPAIKGGKVAYTDAGSGVDADIWVYDLNTNTYEQVTFGGDAQRLEDIDGDTVVYTSFGTNVDIYSYNLTTNVTTRVTSHDLDQEDPAISGHRIVWEDFRNGAVNGDIYVGSLLGPPGTETAVASTGFAEITPAISGSLVAWQEANTQDVLAKDLVTNVAYAVAVSATQQAGSPDVDAGRVAYTARTGFSNWDVFVYDVATGTTRQITTSTADQTNPKISGNLVVWRDNRNGAATFDLYGFDLTSGTEFVVANDPNHDEQLHDIDGGDIAFTDNRTGNYDVYVKRIVVVTPVSATLTLSPAAATNPVGTSHTVTATVTDADGNPVEDVTVRFTVAGSVSASGSCTTDANGQCDFTYQGPAFPGADAITAYADTNGNNVQDAGEPGASATKVWMLPASTPGQVHGAGQLRGASGEKITFGFQAKGTLSGPTGGCHFDRHLEGPNDKVECLNVAALIIIGNMATIYGDALHNGQSTTYVITARENDKPTPDEITITTASGFSAGGPLQHGKVDVKN